jgi:hypothetical protein
MSLLVMVPDCSAVTFVRTSADVSEAMVIIFLFQNDMLRKGGTTYNFEVEDLHTYIARGTRVHNESGFLGEIGNDIDNALDKAFGFQKDGFGDNLTDVLTTPFHIAGSIVEGVKGAAGALLKGAVGAVGSLAAGAVGAVGAVGAFRNNSRLSKLLLISSIFFLFAGAARSSDLFEITSKAGNQIQVEVHTAKGVSLPEQTVVVCAPEPSKEIERLKGIAANFLPTLRYEIVDAENFDGQREPSSYTFVYVGPPIQLMSRLPCLDVVAGFREAVALRTELHFGELQVLQKSLGKHINSFEDLAPLGSCLSSPSTTQIFGRSKNWSIQLRFPAENLCAENYFLFFGFDKVCFHIKCDQREILQWPNQMEHSLQRSTVSSSILIAL